MDFYLLACGTLLAAGLMLNILDNRMFLLAAAVGAGFFLPAPRESAEQFYAFCVIVECLVAGCAIALRARGSLYVAEIAVLLIVSHIMGYALDGSPPFSPYRVIVKILEISQLLVCVVLSPVLQPILRNHDAKAT